MAPFDATNVIDFESTASRKPFSPVKAIVLDPIHPDGTERARMWVHANAVQVWEQNFKAA